VRHEELRDPSDAAEVRICVWQLRLTAGAVVDLSSPECAERQTVDWADLLDDDWSACQALGREILAEGGRGVIAPNAALPGSMSIAIFGARSEISWAAEPRLAVQVPSRNVMRGAPGAGLVRSVRFFGDDYPAGVELAPVAHLLGTREN
jgi:hypothetical protein